MSHNPAMYAVVVAVVLIVAGVSLVGVLMRGSKSYPSPQHRDRAPGPGRGGSGPRRPD